MINDFGILIPRSTFHIPLIQTLNHQCCSIREHRSLVIVTIGMQRVNTIILPQPTIYLVLLFIEWNEIHENSDRFSRYRPAPHPYIKAAFLRLPLPLGKERIILFEIGTFFLRIITIFALPEPWTYKEDFILMCRLQCLGTCRKDCIDSTDFVTHFPTRFKYKVRLQKTFTHEYINKLVQRYLNFSKFHHISCLFSSFSIIY